MRQLRTGRACRIVKRNAERTAHWRGVLAGALACLAAWAGPGLVQTVQAQSAPTQPPTQPPAQAALIERGAYLAKAGDCAGCHTAPHGGSLAGGLPINSPFGTIYSSNITPDAQTGIGRYSFDDFVHAMREGVAPGGKWLYPAMPYASFARIDDDDLRALYAYFMHGVPAVHSIPPPTRLPFPFNQRWGLAVWDLVFAPHRRFEASPDHDAQWNRGAYLVQSFGHCGACHTPRGPAYEELGYDEHSSDYLTGGTNDHWFAPNLTSAQGSGLGRLSEAEIAAFLKTGHAGSPYYGQVFGSMHDVIDDSTQYLSEGDAAAIAHYLKSLPAHAPSGGFDPHSLAAVHTIVALRTGEIELPGAGFYQSFCAKCHGADGAGQAGKYPALTGNPVVLSGSAASLIRIVLEGATPLDVQGSPATSRGDPMPAFGTKLDDAQIAHVLTFIRNAWGNAAAPVTQRDVTRLRTAVAKP